VTDFCRLKRKTIVMESENKELLAATHEKFSTFKELSE